MAAMQRTGRAALGGLTVLSLGIFLSSLAGGCGSTSTSTGSMGEPLKSMTMAFSADGKVLVTWDVDQHLTAVDTHTGQEIARIEGDATALSVAVAPDGSTAATGHVDKFVRLWDLHGKQLTATLKDYPGGVNALAYSPDGKTLASTVGFLSGPGGFLRLVDVARKQAGDVHREPNGIVALAFSPDSKTLAYGSKGKAYLLEAASYKELGDATGATGQTVVGLAFSPDGKLLALGGSEGTVQLWDLEGKKVSATLTGHNLAVHTLAFSPDSKLLASGSEDKSARVWDVAAGKEKFAISGYSRPVRAVVFAADGSALYTASDDKVIKTIDPATGNETAKK